MGKFAAILEDESARAWMLGDLIVWKVGTCRAAD
jgi:hypothetical protein